jgi:hypothetical protein
LQSDNDSFCRLWLFTTGLHDFHQRKKKRQEDNEDEEG